MSSVTGVELGPDYCVLVRARRSASAIEVTAIRIFDHLEWSTDLAIQAGQLREARRELSLPRRAVAVAWTAGRPRNAATPDALLNAAGFRVENILSPADALALLACSRTGSDPGETPTAAAGGSDPGLTPLPVPIRDKAEGATAWVSINHHGVAMAVLREAAVLYSREFGWRIHAPEQRVQAHLLRRYLYVAQLTPELRRAREAVNRQHGLAIDAAIACGNVPDLRSLTMPLIGELDLEIETLDSPDGFKANGRVAAVVAQTAASLRLAGAAAAFGSGAAEGRRHGRWLAVAAVLTLAAGAAWWAFTIWAVSPAGLPALPTAPPPAVLPISAQIDQPGTPVATSAPPGPAPAERPRPRPSIGTQGADRSDGGAGAVTPRPAEALPSVGGILISADRRLAVIDGSIVGVGDRIGTRTVTGIEPNAVVFRELSGKETRVSIRPKTGGS